MVSIYGSGCSNGVIVSSFTKELMNLIHFSETLLDVKSYGSGDIRCGGVLYGINAINIHKFNSFYDGALSRCDNEQRHGGPGYGFSEEKSTDNLIFKYQSVEQFASFSANCSSGTNYLKINKIMIR